MAIFRLVAERSFQIELMLTRKKFKPAHML